MVESQIVKTLDQALMLLNQNDYDIVAGGTDMLIQNRSHTGIPIGFKRPVLYVSHISELNYIRDDESQIYIGATTKLETILKSDLTSQILKDIIVEMASPAIRHTATLAGNIGNASPAGDSLIALYLLDAMVKIQSVDETRNMLVSDFIQGVRKIDLNQNEMITEIIIPKHHFSHVRFEKVAPRLSDAISKLSFCGAVLVENNQIKDFRMAFGAVYMTVVRKREIEEKYINMPIENMKQLVDDIVSDYASYIQPIDDQRSNRIYRKKVALNIIKDFIKNI
jgi:CO/xanthine dehydrogenase FAD-binding subunit